MISKKEIVIATKGNTDIINITQDIERFVKESKITDGSALIFVSGSTAGITTMEYESGLIKDVKIFFEEIAPKTKDYHHDISHGDGNGYSHVRASLLGPSLMVPVSANELQLGTWQQIVLIDFDAIPRDRRVTLKIIGD